MFVYTLCCTFKTEVTCFINNSKPPDFQHAFIRYLQHLEYQQNSNCRQSPMQNCKEINIGNCIDPSACVPLNFQVLIKTASLDNNSRVFTYCSFIRRPRCIHWCIASSHGSCVDDVFGIQVNHTPERNVFCVTRAFSPEQVCSLDSCVLDEKGKYNNVIDSRRRIDHNEKQQQKFSKGKFVLLLILRI